MMNQRRINLAVNAQINPDTAGGVESSTLSILRYYADHPESVRLHILALPQYAARFKEIVGPDHAVHVWTGGQERPILPHVSSPYLRKLQAERLLLGPMIDAAVIGWRVKQFTLGSAAENDAMLRQNGIDLVHFPYGATFPTTLPFIYEPHDIQHRHYPEFFHANELVWRDRVYGEGCQRAAMCVCGSQWTKSDIIKQFGVAPERIAVIPRNSSNASEEVPPERRARIRLEYQLPQRFAYYPAMTFPHKNHLRLFEALARLRDRDGIVIPLVLTGRLHKPSAREFAASLNRLGLENQVRFLSVVPPEVLTALYQLSWFVVFPSLFEGLSQSLLEALRLQVPIIAANQTSIPETVGNAALLFDGKDVDDITSALRRAASDEAMLQSLAGQAKTQFSRYSWDSAGPTLTSVYRKALDTPLSEGDS